MKREKMSKFLSTHVKVLCNVLAGLVQLVLVQDDVEHFRRTLRQLLGRHQLHVYVAGLRLEEQQHALQRSMALILDGNSEIGSHVRSNLCYLICLRHLIISGAVTNRTYGICPKLPSNISTMQRPI